MHELSTRDWIFISVGGLAAVAALGVAIGLTVQHQHTPKHPWSRH